MFVTPTEQAGIGAAVTLVVVGVAARRALALWRSTTSSLAARRARARQTMSAARDPRWWRSQRDRRAMWLAVSRADTAVRRAAAAGVPVGDLPGLLRQLRAAAAPVDVALAAASGTAHESAARSQARDIVTAADEVTDALVAGVTTATAPTIAALADTLRVEVAAVRHGWGRAAGH